MAFWLNNTGQRSHEEHWSLDHFSRTAVQKYCDYVGGKFFQAFGDEFGKTLEAFHCDSFELANLPNGIYWSDSLLDDFQNNHGYDLTKYLPAIWWDVGGLSPYVRYDVSELLHHMGFEAFFHTFLGWCEKHGIKGSMEPIGFPTDVIQSTGLAPLPMMEVTPGEKDIVPWFDTRIGPKKYIASGAHLYGRNVVAVEAYTYIHWELYRATLEELKIVSDGFFPVRRQSIYQSWLQLLSRTGCYAFPIDPIRRADFSYQLLVGLLSITRGLCVPMFVFTTERPFHCRYRGVLSSRQSMDIRCFERPDVDARI